MTASRPHRDLAILSPVNPSNPYEIVGQLHNDALEFVLAGKRGKKSPSIHEIMERVTLFFSTYGMAEVGGPDMKENQKVLSKILDKLISEYVEEDKLVFNFNLSDTAQHELNWLLELISEYPKKEYPLTVFKRRLLDWEYGLDALELPDEEVAALYVAGSIARHSSYYWIKQLILEDRKTGPKAETARKGNCKNKPKCRKTSRVVDKDIQGGALGAIAGSGFGPIGVLIGGLIGGAAASANEHYNKP